MKLYFGRVSGNSSRSLFALEEAGGAFERNVIDTKAGEQREAHYLAVNPMGKIPALVDGDVRLWESNAINLYVAEKHPEAKLLPTSIASRASVFRWLFFQTAHVSPALMVFVRNRHERVRTYWNIPQNLSEIAFGERELARYLPVLESALQGREYLEGDFSLADIAYVPHMVVAHEAGVSYEAYPAVNAWFERLRARPAWKRTYAQVFGETA